MYRVAVLAVTAFALSTSGAFAVSEVVKQACSSDYAAYCSEHKVGTPGLKSCMRAHRKMLSAPCVNALGHSDEVTPEDVRLYKAEMHRE